MRVSRAGRNLRHVEREQLRELQAPLKERYRQDPAAAVVTLSASGELGEEVSCSVQTGRAIAEAGLHPASGGDGSVRGEGDLDFRGKLAVDSDARSASARSGSPSSSTATPTKSSSRPC